MPYLNRRLNNIEDILRTYHKSYLKVIEKIYGIEVRLVKQRKDVHSDVYGIDSGDTDGEPVCIMGVITGDDFFPSGGFSSGSFTSGFLYSSAGEVEVGDTVEVFVSDDLTRRFKIEACEAIGTTQDVFRRFKLASLGS